MTAVPSASPPRLGRPPTAEQAVGSSKKSVTLITRTKERAIAARSLSFGLWDADDRYRCSSGHAVVLTIAVALTGIAYAAGAPLAAGGPTVAACLALLLVGLPHGALDIELLKRGTALAEGKAGGIGSVGLLLLAYLGLAGAMLLLWRAAPVLALVAFLLTAVAHFGEDWAEADQPALALGTAAALLCAPALTHHDQLAAVFQQLCGTMRAASIADGMLMLAPVALAIAAVTVLRLVTLGRTAQGVATVAVLTAMVTLPPVIGFALFFCVHHSPRHLRDAWRSLARRRVALSKIGRATVSVTVAALGIAALLYATEFRVELAARTIAAAFTTLSILTVPHMALPAIVARLSNRRTRSPHPASPG